ncbi:MAG TPA: ATP-binding protein, partial [Solirubrobacteraceae bacterium]|nr:ATP-binding protein [Solirubrobacteraceae bacterium]
MTVLDRVRDSGLLAAGEPVVVLLSGGRDSVCLLDCAVAIGARVTALHVNYGLRPEAHADEGFCRELCDRLAVPLVVERAGEPARGNLQAWARDVRYRAAERLEGAVATGHTATDQAETVLYR